MKDKFAVFVSLLIAIPIGLLFYMIPSWIIGSFNLEVGIPTQVTKVGSGIVGGSCTFALFLHKMLKK